MTLLTRIDQHGGIMHALPQEVVPEKIASFALIPCLLTPSDRPLQTGTNWYFLRCRSRKQQFLETAQISIRKHSLNY